MKERFNSTATHRSGSVSSIATASTYASSTTPASTSSTSSTSGGGKRQSFGAFVVLHCPGDVEQGGGLHDAIREFGERKTPKHVEGGCGCTYHAAPCHSHDTAPPEIPFFEARHPENAALWKVASAALKECGSGDDNWRFPKVAYAANSCM